MSLPRKSKRDPEPLEILGAGGPPADPEPSVAEPPTPVGKGAGDLWLRAPPPIDEPPPRATSDEAPLGSLRRRSPGSTAGLEGSGLLAPGSTFGVYRVGPCIGEGGMARIYQAEHAGLRRQVALKVLIDDFARHPEGRERFLREARVAAAVKHPNVVNIFDVGVHENIPFMVMELLEGQDLEQLLDWRGALDQNLIIDIMVPVVAGLSAVHDAGIVHRDLKPGNIFLARGRYNDLEPKLLDFGICKAAGHDQLKLTADRMLIGTPLYVAPEGLQNAETTPLSDQYSLGVVMYECATGCAPFSASTFTELSRMIVAGQYTPPGARNPDLSKRLAAIIEKAMSRDPERRYRDLRAMGRELLLLAGQRTRITWGLSFGHAGHAVNTLPSMSAGRPAEGRRWSPGRAIRRLRAPPARAFLTMAPLLLLAGALFAWFPRTGDSDKRRAAVSGGAQAYVPVPGPAEALGEPPALEPPPSIAAPRQDPAAADPPAVVPVSSLPPVRAPAATASPPPRREPRPAVRPASEPAPSRKAAKPVASSSSAVTTPSRSTPPEPEPAWALPAFHAPPDKADDVRIGPNDSPILN